MTNAIDDAIARLQNLSEALTTVSIKSAPDYPVENAEPAPFSIAHLARGTGVSQSSGMLKHLFTVNVDFYFSRVSIKHAYQLIDLLAYEFLQRLAGDPTLDSKISTIVFSDPGVDYEDLGAVAWGNVQFHLLRFTVPMKVNATTTATST